MDLFDAKLEKDLAKRAPLPERMRPRTLAEFVGQQDLVGEGKLLRALLLRDEVPSMIFWGPPGSGKTTLARIIAEMTKSVFVQLSATSSGLADLRKTLAEAEDRRKLLGKRTILFIDEIHRWNKGQQDALLPFVENGVVTLIGATTENPSFEVNGALLSRARVFVLQALAAADIRSLLERALADRDRGLGGSGITVEPEALVFLAEVANGDARTALSVLEYAVKAAGSMGGGESGSAEVRCGVTVPQVKEALQKTHLLYDKGGEEHYNIISALHKSMRGSDADAALYWLGRMLEAGEDPLYVARRVVRFAAEDIGLADPEALVVAVAASQAAHWVGMPECNVLLAEAVAYCARAPKSNALYEAYRAVQRDIAERPAYGVPLHLRNAPTKIMKELDYGKGYQYNPDHDGPVDQAYLPDELKGRKYLRDEDVGRRA
jgi:putative ATPase